jgi:hypothetical protein
MKTCRWYFTNANCKFVSPFSKTWLSLLAAGQEVSLKVDVEKTKYIFMSHQQNAGQNQKIHTANKSSENVTVFKYLGIIPTLIKKFTAHQIW